MTQYYRLLDNVILSPEIEVKVKELADHFHATTQKDIVVTSGLRTSQSQALAMYDKLASGDHCTIYLNQDAAQSIRHCYLESQQCNSSREVIIERIRLEIDK